MTEWLYGFFAGPWWNFAFPPLLFLGAVFALVLLFVVSVIAFDR